MECCRAMSDQVKQCVIIANGSFLPNSLINKIIADKYVLALDGAFNQLHELAIMPNALLGDLDSVDKQLLENSEVTIVPAPDQNKTDLQKGIAYCDRLGASQVEIICATGGERMDHALGNFRALRSSHNPERDLCLHTAHQTIRFVKDSSCEIHGKPGDKCGIMAFPEAYFTSTGLRWNGDNHLLEFALSDSTCNELISECAKIQVRGEALIIGPLRRIEIKIEDCDSTNKGSFKR